MIYIHRQLYTALDWHDWKATTKWLGKEKDGYVIPKGEGIIERYIINDIENNLIDLPRKARQTAIKKLISLPIGGQFTIKEFPKQYEKFTISKISDREYRLNLEGQVEYYADYFIDEIPDGQQCYLPVREFQCAPKLSPQVHRTEFAYTQSLTDALRLLHEMQPVTNEQRMPFMDESHILLIGKKQDFEGNPWYERERELVNCAGSTKEYWDTFHPFAGIHEQNLKKYQQSEDTETVQ